MTRDEIERILEYCRKATQGPWTRSRTEPKLLTSNTPGSSGKPKNVCQLAGQTHNEDWQNYHFLTKAREDLPRLARHYLRLREYLKSKNQQLEQERGKKKWLQLKRRNKQAQLERGRQKWLLLQKENEQLRQEIANKEKQIEEAYRMLELEQANSRLASENFNVQIEQERTQKQLELEKAQNKLKLHGSGKGEDMVGFCDGLLNKLKGIETDFNSSGQFWQYEESKSHVNPEKKTDDDKHDIILSNDELLGQLNEIEASLRPAKTRRQRRSKSTENAEAAARQFIEPSKNQGKTTSKSKS